MFTWSTVSRHPRAQSISRTTPRRRLAPIAFCTCGSSARRRARRCIGLAGPDYWGSPHDHAVLDGQRLERPVPPASARLARVEQPRSRWQGMARACHRRHPGRAADPRRTPGLHGFRRCSSRRSRSARRWDVDFSTWLKYVLKSTSQRRDAGRRASASTKSGKRIMPGRNTRNTVRRESARNDSARTPAQPPSPVSACQARAMPGWRSPFGGVRPAGISRGSPSHAPCMKPGWLRSQAGPASGRSAPSSTTWWAYLLGRPE